MPGPVMTGPLNVGSFEGLSGSGGEQGVMGHGCQGTIFCQIGREQVQKGQKFRRVETINMQGTPEHQAAVVCGWWVKPQVRYAARSNKE